MTNLDLERKKLEEYILAAALLENRIVEVIHFLSWKNFSKWDDFDYQQAWVIITEMYKSNKIIDLMTFAIEYKKKFKKSIFDHSIEIMNKVASVNNTQKHAAILVQIDITNKLVDLLSQLSMNQNLPEYERISFKDSASKLSDYSIDIFLAIQGIEKMVVDKKYSEVSKKYINSFIRDVELKIHNIKHYEAKTALISNIRCLCISEKAKYLLMQLENEI